MKSESLAWGWGTQKSVLYFPRGPHSQPGVGTCVPIGASRCPLPPPSTRVPEEGSRRPLPHPPRGHPREHFKTETISCSLCSKLDLSLGFYEINSSKLLSWWVDLLGPPPAQPPTLLVLLSHPLHPSPSSHLSPSSLSLGRRTCSSTPAPFREAPEAPPIRPLPSHPLLQPWALILSSIYLEPSLSASLFLPPQEGGDQVRYFTRGYLARGWQSL